MSFIQDKYINLFRKLLICLFSFFFIIVATSSCNHNGDGSGDDTAFIIELLTGAEPDECFCGIGDPENGPLPVSGTCLDIVDNPDNDSELDEIVGCQPKVNYNYVWSLAKIHNDIWFGTLANASCLIGIGFIAGTGGTPAPFFERDFQTGSITNVCEFGESHVAPSKPSPLLGDHRTPKIYFYDTSNDNLTERFVDNCEGGTELLETTIGLRGGGALDNGETKIVILGGPSFFGGLNLFAFDPETKLCVAAQHFDEYNDFRKALVVNGVLYAAVGKTPDEDNPQGGGRILRYIGDSSNPLLWEEVGNLDTIGAFITVHEGRIFVGTWPNLSAALLGQDLEFPDPSMIPPFSGIFMSPPLPSDGLTSLHADLWEKVWNVLQYEPDPTIAATYGLGDLTSFEGHLYWGTIHVPTVSFFVHAFVFEPDLLGDGCSQDPECSGRLAEADNKANRSTSVFRGKNFDTIPEIDLLYGESSFPVFNPNSGWTTQPNSSSLTPLFGPSGFFENARTKTGEFDLTNFYTWTLAVYRNQAFLGTADAGGEPPSLPGADLYRFSDLESAAVPLTIDGFGFPDVSGFRTIISDEDGEDNDDGLYIGVAGRQNLSVGAGWKLLRLK